jgi:hypothetical protein
VTGASWRPGTACGDSSAWIKTVKPEDADDKFRALMEAQRSLYPPEYASPVPAVDGDDAPGIVASHSLIPEAMYHAFSTFGALMSPELPASTTAVSSRSP